eukprot:10092-Heterococcus_DN1.PRE.1
MGSILNLAGDATVADAAAEMVRQDVEDGKPLTRIVGAKCGCATALSRSVKIAHTIAATAASKQCNLQLYRYTIVNSRQVSMSHALKDGDVISLITTSATCSSPTATSASKAASASTGSSTSNNGQQQQQQPLGRVHTQAHHSNSPIRKAARTIE